MTEDEAACCIDVPAHSVGMHDETFDEPGEAIEHVVEREE